MVRQRWLQFQTAEEEHVPSPGKRRRSDELMEWSPAAGGCDPDRIRNMGSSESEVHLLSVNRDYLGEGIVKYVDLLSDLKGFTLIIIPGPKVFLVNPNTSELEATTGMTCAGLLKGKLADAKSEEPSDKHVF